MFIDDTGKAALFMRQCPADNILHGGVSGNDNALLHQVVHQFPKHIDRLAKDGCHLLGASLQRPAYRGIRIPVTAEFKNHSLLFKTCALGNVWINVIKAREVSLSYIGGVFFHLCQVEDEEHQPGLEVSQLQNEKQPGFMEMQLL